jgi:hypothetical protein
MCASRVGHPKDPTCVLKGGLQSRSPSDELPSEPPNCSPCVGW